jgi:hypothetical protein
MKWIANVYRPISSEYYYLQTFELMTAGLEWLAGKVVGLPQETELLSVNNLVEMGIVGVYDEC